VKSSAATWRSRRWRAPSTCCEINNCLLGGSGHIAGIVNLAAAMKCHYCTHDAMPDAPEERFDAARPTPGSWWEDRQARMQARDGGEAKVPARVPGDGKLKAIEDAPGNYAMLRLGSRKSE
jgi:polyhydroxyalkanoate synthase